MINRVVLLGRLTKDPELRTTQNGISTCTFTVAVDRIKKDEADFPQCVAWRQQADYLTRYGHKGDMVGVDGRIQTRTYDKDGRTVYVTEIVVDSLQLVGGRKDTTDTTNDYWQPEPKPKKEPDYVQAQMDIGTRMRSDTEYLDNIKPQDLSSDDLPF